MDNGLYAWQRECLDKWMANGGRGIVSAVTGSGKTRLALAAVRRLEQELGPSLLVRVVVPTSSLMRQWETVFLDYISSTDGQTSGCAAGGLMTEIGCIGGGRTSPKPQRYMIYVINSARYQLARSILSSLAEGRPVFLIADECHRYTSGENQKIFEFLPYLQTLPGTYYSMGLSATPRAPGYASVLVPALGRQIYHYGFEAARKKGTICDFIIYQISLPFDCKEMEEYGELTERLSILRARLRRIRPFLARCGKGQFFMELHHIMAEEDQDAAALARQYLHLTFKRKRIVCMAKSRLSCAMDLIRRLERHTKIIIFGERIEQAEQLYEALREQYPGQVGRYHSRMGEQANRNTLTRFRDGMLRILISCRALDEGLDVPEAAAAIILSGTSVERQRIQRLGRILRRSDKKRVACLYYLFVRDSSEEQVYFPEKMETFRTEELLYDKLPDGRNGLIYPSYEQAASRLLRMLRKKNAKNAFLQTARDCLAKGMLRPDWLIGKEFCEERLKEARTTRERNYWMCMRWMACGAFCIHREKT